MATLQPTLAGTLATHPQAAAFAEVVQQVHHRYASEVVGAFELCPFMNDPATAFGRFCVMLEREPTLDEALRMVREAGVQVVHLVYPLVACESLVFEHFGSRLHDAVAQSIPSPPVHATFHPQMEGDRSSAARLVGLLRHAPDPFIQFVPAGLHKGGTAFLDLSTMDLKTWLAQADAQKKKSLLDRLSSQQLDDIVALQQSIREERHERYAPYLQRC